MKERKKKTMEKVLSEREDFFNANGTRNANNTDEDDYNCAGYALNTFSWYIPYKYDVDEEEFDIECMLMDEMSKEEIYEVKLAEYINRMLKDFSNLRVLTSPTDVKSNERLIYFRIFYELLSEKSFESDNGSKISIDEQIHTDFHYRYFENGKWWEKCGGSELREVPIEEMKGPWICGSNIYDSRTVYLALKMED